VTAVPTFLEQWALSVQSIEALAKLDRVVSLIIAVDPCHRW
jgi:hypothetical protein